MQQENNTATEITVSRRLRDRRGMLERRIATDTENKSYSGEERRTSKRRKVERRRQIAPTTCERDYTSDEIEFMTAMDDYKRKSGRQFPTWSEVLEVVQSLGYRRVAEPSEITL